MNSVIPGAQSALNTPISKLKDDQNLIAKAVATFSSKGKRQAQEDHFLVDREKGVFIVADGFGGPKHGLEVAKLVCESVKGFLYKEARDLDATLPFILRNYFSLAGNVLFNALIHANRQARKYNKDKNINEKGGASVIAGFVDGDLLALANVGVCSGWLLRDGKAAELVLPRSYARLVNPFKTDGPLEHQVPLMAVGMAEDLEPEILEYRLRPNDWLIFSTDGMPRSVCQNLLDIKQGGFNDSTTHSITNMLNQLSYEDNVSISIMIF